MAHLIQRVIEKNLIYETHLLNIISDKNDSLLLKYDTKNKITRMKR
jgi:hypothetical protein